MLDPEDCSQAEDTEALGQGGKKARSLPLSIYVPSKSFKAFDVAEVQTFPIHQEKNMG